MSNQNCCPHCIHGYVMELYNEWRCLNCGCRPEYWHKRFLHEPDGRQPWKGPESPYLLKRALSA